MTSCKVYQIEEGKSRSYFGYFYFVLFFERNLVLTSDALNTIMKAPTWKAIKLAITQTLRSSASTSSNLSLYLCCYILRIVGVGVDLVLTLGT